MTQSHEPLFDQGLQLERTLLAWWRTLLVLVLAGAVIIRFSLEPFGALAAGAAFVLIGITFAVYLASYRRYRRVLKGLNLTGTLPRNGSAVAWSSVGLLVVGVVSAAYVLQRGLSSLDALG